MYLIQLMKKFHLTNLQFKKRHKIDRLAFSIYQFLNFSIFQFTAHIQFHFRRCGVLGFWVLGYGVNDQFFNLQLTFNFIFDGAGLLGTPLYFVIYILFNFKLL